MLRHPPTNLNRQSEDATILLIREVQARGIQLSEARLSLVNTPLATNHLSPGIRRRPRHDQHLPILPLFPLPRYRLYSN